MDWCSGPDHTTVLNDLPELLRVRDSNSLSSAGKRFIRLKPRPRE